MAEALDERAGEHASDRPHTRPMVRSLISVKKDDRPLGVAAPEGGPAIPRPRRWVPRVVLAPTNPAGRAASAWAYLTDRRGITAQTLVSGGILGILLHMRWGYSAGGMDHLVLSPLGLHWYRPDWFANDWVFANAPQPHWLFDVITWLSAEAGGLKGVAAAYFLYFVLSVAVFGLATAILAKAWAPTHRWAAIVIVTVIAAVTPQWLLGTGSPLLAIALPGVLGGFLIYLTGAALLTGRNRLAVLAGVATALAHVQQGAVAGVLLGLIAGAQLIRRLPVDRKLVVGAVVVIGIVVAELRLRPVAGHLKDFADACNTLIPAHCNATTWDPVRLAGGLAMVGLGLLTVLYLPSDERFRWVAVVALPSLLLVAGIAVDRLDVPVLGMLAQGTNVYRLDALLLPFAIWGALLPLFTPRPQRQRLVLLGVVEVLGLLSLAPPGLWPLQGRFGGLGMVMVAIVLTLAVLEPDWRGSRPALGWVTPAAVTVMAVCIVTSALVVGGLRPLPFHPGLLPKGSVLAWGTAVQKAVPPGGQILIPPGAMYVRMATKRGVVADCKNAPYGGPAWQDYKERMTALGGIEQCLAGKTGYRELQTDQLVAVAKRYGADYILLEHASDYRRWTLPQEGWKLVVGPVRSQDNYLFKAPWAA